jgi:hypothetical protein
MAKKVRFSVSPKERDFYRYTMKRGVTAALDQAKAEMRTAVERSKPGDYNADQLWDPAWWTAAVDGNIAPALWTVYWKAAQRAAERAGLPAVPNSAYRGIESRWRAQVASLYGYAETVQRRVVELTLAGADEPKGWMLDKLGLVAAAGPLSPGIGNGMADTEALAAENGGSAEGVGFQGTKTWLQTGPRPRQTHIEADGQVVGWEELFIVGGFEGEYPGDAALPPEERCNCECSVEYAVDEWQPVEVDGTLEPLIDELAQEAVDAAGGPGEVDWGDYMAAQDLQVPPTVQGTASIDTDLRKWAEQAVPMGDANSADLIGLRGPVQTVQDAVAHTAEVIDGVHGMPADMPGTTVHWMPANKTEAGIFRVNEETGESLIAIRSGDSPHMTFAHEAGHYFDSANFDTPPGRYATGSASIIDGRYVVSVGDESFAPFFDAVLETPEIQNLVGIYEQLATTGEAILDGVRYTASGPVMDALEYVLDPQEIFARAYSQFIAVESGDALMLRELARMVTFEGTGPLISEQWLAGNFGGVQDALRTLFRGHGLVG